MNSESERPKSKRLGLGWSKKDGKFLNQSVRKKDFDELPVDEYGCVKFTAILLDVPDEKAKNTHLIVSDDYIKKAKQVKLN